MHEFVMLVGVGGCTLILVMMAYLLRGLPFIKTILISVVVFQVLIMTSSYISMLVGHKIVNIANMVFWLVGILLVIYITYLCINLLRASIIMLVRVVRDENKTS